METLQAANPCIIRASSDFRANHKQRGRRNAPPPIPTNNLYQINHPTNRSTQTRSNIKTGTTYRSTLSPRPSNTRREHPSHSIENLEPNRRARLPSHYYATRATRALPCTKIIVPEYVIHNILLLLHAYLEVFAFGIHFTKQGRISKTQHTMHTSFSPWPHVHTKAAMGLVRDRTA